MVSARDIAVALVVQTPYEMKASAMRSDECTDDRSRSKLSMRGLFL